MLSLPELVIKVKVDDTGAKQSLKKLQGTANDTTSSMGSGFTKVGDIIKGVLGADIIKQFAGKLLDLGKQTLQLVSDYEQLEGGMKKIFDQADQAQILEDANNAWEDLNMSANEYLSAINQVGASFAQTMGDQKGYDVARKGMKAIADYASGTGRNLSELNEKYKMITRSTASYQSIADQFSGLLPATSKDFLEQAQAAGYLSEEYTKLTDVPVPEYQEAVTEMLEKGTKEMGLYGNTAAETAKTISGSINGMKSAWQNLLASFGSGNQKEVQKAMKTFVKSLGYVVKNLGPAVATIGKSIVKLIYNGIKNAIKSGKAGDVAKILINRVSKLMTDVGKKLPTLIPKIYKWLTEGIQKLLNKASDILNNESTGKFASKLMKGLQKLLSGLVEGLIKSIPIVIKAFPKIIAAIMNFLLSYTKRFVKIGLELIGSLALGFFDGIGKAFMPVLNALSRKWDEIKTTAINKWNEFKTAAINKWGEVKAAIEEKINAIKQVWDNVKFVAKAAKVWLDDQLSAAKDRIMEMWDKLDPKKKKFLMTAIDHAYDAIKRVKDLWEELLGMKKTVTFTPTVGGGVGGGGGGAQSTASPLLNNLLKRSLKKGKKRIGKSASGWRSGLDFVPYDEFPATLHYGEMVLSRSEANAYRKQQINTSKAASQAANQPIIVNTDLYVDGRKIASTTAPYMRKAIDKLDAADNRQLGFI